METFDRSHFGRQNRALFYGVDRTIYIEGGPASADKATDTFDALFWRQTFLAFRPELKIKLIPRGSKETVIKLALDTQYHKESSTLFAVDRDYDSLFGRLIDRPDVIYTFGYSLENDIFHPDLLTYLFFVMCPVCDIERDVEELLEGLIADFCNDVWWAQLADVCGNIISRKVIDRERPTRYIPDHRYGKKPKLAKSVLQKDVARANSGLARKTVRHAPLKKSDLPRFAVGHLYAAFCYKSLMYLHSKYSRTAKPSKDAITSIAVANFSNWLHINRASEIARYYQNALKDI